jgi:hypothetical protein
MAIVFPYFPYGKKGLRRRVFLFLTFHPGEVPAYNVQVMLQVLLAFTSNRFE